MVIVKMAFMSAYEINFLVQIDSYIFFYFIGQYLLGCVHFVIK